MYTVDLERVCLSFIGPNTTRNTADVSGDLMRCDEDPTGEWNVRQKQNLRGKRHDDHKDSLSRANRLKN
jgi:hypothetical protein